MEELKGIQGHSCTNLLGRSPCHSNVGGELTFRVPGLLGRVNLEPKPYLGTRQGPCAKVKTNHKSKSKSLGKYKLEI